MPESDQEKHWLANAIEALTEVRNPLGVLALALFALVAMAYIVTKSGLTDGFLFTLLLALVIVAIITIGFFGFVTIWRPHHWYAEAARVLEEESMGDVIRDILYEEVELHALKHPPEELLLVTPEEQE